jgi:hypothetical protein
LPEVVDELPEGVVGVAEACGGVFLGQPFDEDGTQGFVLALPAFGGFSEELQTEGVVHGVVRCEVIAGRGAEEEGTRKKGCGQRVWLGRLLKSRFGPLRNGDRLGKRSVAGKG